MPHPRSGPTYAGLRIGLLGGSFNPAHEGHRAISLHALKQLNLDQIWWLVSPQNPLKSAHDMAALDERIKTARTVAKHPRIKITDIESRFSTRYTVDLLRHLTRRFSRTRFVWLMGADNMQQVTHWRDWQDIFKLVPVAVFRRPAYAAGRNVGKAAHRFDRNWHPASFGSELAQAPSPAWIVMDNPAERHVGNRD